MVRSPKSISGAVGATLENAPYSDGDRNTVPTSRLRFTVMATHSRAHLEVLV